jgi:hypothetical protein
MKKAQILLVIFCFLAVFLLEGNRCRAQGIATFHIKKSTPAFDSIKLRNELYILESNRPLSFEQARKKLNNGQGKPLVGPQSFKSNNKFLRGFYEYWLLFQVENLSGTPLVLVIEQAFIKKAWIEEKGKIHSLPKSKGTTQGSLFSLSSGETYRYALGVGQKYQFYLYVKDLTVDQDLSPVLWNQDRYNTSRYDRHKSIVVGQSIFLGLFFTLAIISTIFFLSRRRPAFGWYSIFKWSLALYFLQEVTEFNVIYNALPAHYDCTIIKAGLLASIFYAYLQYVRYFVKDRPGSETIESIYSRDAWFLAGYFLIDLILQLLNQPYLSWVLIYFFLWIVVLHSIRVIGFLGKIHYPPTKYLFRGTVALISGFCLSLLGFTFFDKQMIHYQGVELGFLPLGLGGVLEGIFFFISLGELEKNWLQERLAYQTRETRALNARQIHEHLLQVNLEQELSAIKRQLDTQEQEILSNQEADIKDQRALAYKRLQLRTLRYGFLAQTSDDILQQLNQHVANDQVLIADEQLTRFGGFIRDLLFLAAEPSLAIQTEINLCKRLAQLNHFQIGFPAAALQPHWKCPSLLFLSLMYHSMKLLPQNAKAVSLHQEEHEDKVLMRFESHWPPFNLAENNPEIWVDALEQLANFNQGAGFIGVLSGAENGWTVSFEKS